MDTNVQGTNVVSMNVLGLNSVLYIDVSWCMMLFMVLPVYMFV